MERLYLAQPSLSERIKNLEEGLGIEILERGRNRVESTPVIAFSMNKSSSYSRPAKCYQENRSFVSKNNRCAEDKNKRTPGDTLYLAWIPWYCLSKAEERRIVTSDQAGTLLKCGVSERVILALAKVSSHDIASVLCGLP